MRVLVLGGTGFVGPLVVHALLELGHDVTLYHHGRREPPLVARATHVHGDFSKLAGRLAELVKPTPRRPPPFR